MRRDDILWRNAGGTVVDWLANARGAFAHNSGAFSRTVDAKWTIIGSGDFNGDGRDDVLWRHAGGTITNWLSTSEGAFVDNNQNFARMVSNDWRVVGTGDYNGDGRDDILWRHTNGTVTDWLANDKGGFNDNGDRVARVVAAEWSIVATGDFNGDGHDDILWRNNAGTVTDWLGKADGTFHENWSLLLRTVPHGWSIVGAGDFNGDGRDDILWRHADGTITDWLGTTAGTFTDNAHVLARVVSQSWQVMSTGDFNGDGRDDILWRNADGTVTDWLATANGGFVDNASAFTQVVGSTWQIEPSDYLI